jgi:DNA-binding response OmpR family regulator
MITIPIVLVVDDERSVREALARLFAREGIGALTASTLDEARLLCARHRGSLRAVVIDLCLGGENGLDLVRELAGEPGAPRLLVFSASVDGLVRERALALGADEVLAKPSSPPAILAALRRELGPLGLGVLR